MVQARAVCRARRGRTGDELPRRGAFSPAQRKVLFDVAPRGTGRRRRGQRQDPPAGCLFRPRASRPGRAVRRTSPRSPSPARPAPNWPSASAASSSSAAGPISPAPSTALPSAPSTGCAGACSAAEALKAGVDPSFGSPRARRRQPDQRGDVEAGLGAGWSKRPARSELEVLASPGQTVCASRRSPCTTGCGAWGRSAAASHRARSGRECPSAKPSPHSCRDALTEAHRLPKRGASLERRSGEDRPVPAVARARRRPAAGSPGWRRRPTFFPSRKTASAEPWLAPVRAALARYRCALAEEELRPLVDRHQQAAGRSSTRSTRRTRSPGRSGLRRSGVAARRDARRRRPKRRCRGPAFVLARPGRRVPGHQRGAMRHPRGAWAPTGCSWWATSGRASTLPRRRRRGVPPAAEQARDASQSASPRHQLPQPAGDTRLRQPAVLARPLLRPSRFERLDRRSRARSRTPERRRRCILPRQGGSWRDRGARGRARPAAAEGGGLAPPCSRPRPTRWPSGSGG